MVEGPSSTESPIDLSIVLPCRNVGSTLADQLVALTAERWHGSWEILVVDNGSVDDTVEVATGFPSVRVVAAAERPGLSYARNVGLSQARGRSVAFCDGDDVVRSGWLSAMGDALAQHSFVAGTLDVDLLNPDWLARTRGRPSHDELATFHGIYPTAPGGNLGVRLQAALDVGGFDERSSGAEDAEFSLRMWLAGHDLVLAPDAVVHYRYGCGVRSLWRQGLTYGAGRPLVARRVRDLDVGSLPRLQGWKSWLWLLRHLLDLRSREGRSSLAWVAANRLGHLRGSWSHRTVFL